MKATWTALAGAVLLAGAAAASGATVADLEFRDPLWGEPIDPADLKDRVVAVYFWAAD